MAIKALGESLLSSAKKKAKRGQKLGQLAGLAMVGMSIANSNIRKKAMTRYNEWNNSLTPIKKALDKDFVELGNTEAEYKTRSAYATGELQSFIDEKFEKLKLQTGDAAKGETQPSDQLYLEMAKKEALPEYNAYLQRVEAYKSMFGMKSDEYYKQYNNLDKLTSDELKNDNLMELLGNKTGWGKNTEQVATEIMLANGQKSILNIPANIREKFDIEYFDEISRRARRAMTAQEIRDTRAVELNEKAKTTDAKVLLSSVTPKPSSAVKIDEKVSGAMSVILQPKIQTGPKKGDSNPEYIGEDFTYMDPDDKYTTTYKIEELFEELEKINFDTQEPFKETELGGKSNRDVLVNKALEYAQLLKTKFLLEGSGVIDDTMYRGWARKGLQEALKGVTIETDPGILFGLGPNSAKISLSYVPPKKDEEPEVPVPIVLLRNKIAEYQDNPMGMPSGVLKDIQRIVEELPEYKDEFSVYLPEEDDMTRVDGTQKSDTGFKGPIKNKVDNSTMTEVSIGVMIDGKETLVPAINELTTDDQLETLQNLKIGVDPIPEDIQITAKEAAIKRMEEGKSPFYEEEETPAPSPTPAPTPAPDDSLLSPNIPTQAELVKDFEILGADKLSSEEIDARLNEMINQKDDFTPDEYIKLITYLNSKQGIMPRATSLLEPTPELTDSEIIANALKGSGTGRNPLEVLNDMNISNFEKALENVKNNKSTLGVTTTSKKFREYVSENYNDKSFTSLSKSDKIKAIEEYIKTLQS